MAHLDPEVLAALALGDAGASTPDAARHLGGCPACRDEVAELRRVRDGLAAASSGMPLQHPPESVWAGVSAALAADAASEAAVIAGPAAADPTPDRARTRIALVAVDGQPAPAGGRRWSGWLVAASVAATLVLGFGLGWIASDLTTGPGATTRATVAATVASARLDTPGTTDWQGSAELVRESGEDQLRVTVTAPVAGEGYLEVWLLNRDGARMVSIGVLGVGGSASFPVDARLLDRGYVTVDVSREAFDDRPTHSGDSLARGTLAE